MIRYRSKSCPRDLRTNKESDAVKGRSCHADHIRISENCNHHNGSAHCRFQTKYILTVLKYGEHIILRQAVLDRKAFKNFLFFLGKIIEYKKGTKAVRRGDLS